MVDTDMDVTCLLCSGLQYLIPQWLEFASHTEAKTEKMNSLQPQSPGRCWGQLLL